MARLSLVREMITQFTEVLIDNLASDSVWTFFSSCLSIKMIVTCPRLTKQVSHLLLSSLASSPLLAEKVKDKQQAKLLSSLVKFCLTDTTLGQELGACLPSQPQLTAGPVHEHLGAGGLLRWEGGWQGQILSPLWV